MAEQEAKGLHVLLIEDNPDDVELALHAFRVHKLANSVHVCRDGVEAVDYLFGEGSSDRVVPKLILLDFKLPRMDGPEVLARIRAEERTRLTPVVMLTSSRDESDVARSYRAGANSYIIKPVDFEQFTEAVRQVGLYWLLINQSTPVV